MLLENNNSHKDGADSLQFGKRSIVIDHFAIDNLLIQITKHETIAKLGSDSLIMCCCPLCSCTSPCLSFSFSFSLSFSL